MWYQFNLKREVSQSDKQFKIAIISRRRSEEDSLFQDFYHLNAWNRLQRRKEWICESRCQVRDCLHFFAEYFDLNPYPFATTVYARSAFCTRPAFYTQSSFTPAPQSLVRSPQSAVRSPQSAVRSPQSAVHSPQSTVHSLALH